MIKINILAMIAFICAFTLYSTTTHSQGTPKYNVIMICQHDMNDHVGFLGNPEPYTPNFNRLVAHSMLFYRHYCQYPLCSPSRSSFLSGWRPDETQIFDNETRPRSKMGSTVKFLPEYFDQYGYRTERYGMIMQAAFENDIRWDYAEPPETPSSLQIDVSFVDSSAIWYISNAPDTVTYDGA